MGQTKNSRAEGVVGSSVRKRAHVFWSSVILLAWSELVFLRAVISLLSVSVCDAEAALASFATWSMSCLMVLKLAVTVAVSLTRVSMRLMESPT